MAGRPDYIANVVIETGEGKARWREIGVAFVSTNQETISVLLDAVPISTGRIVLTRPRERGAEQRARAEK